MSDVTENSSMTVHTLVNYRGVGMIREVGYLECEDCWR